MIEMRVVAPGSVGPVFICDHCGKRIDNIRMGMVKHGLIHTEPAGTATPHFIVHKGDCDRATVQSSGWTELKDYAIRVIANSIPPDDRDKESMTKRFQRLVDSLYRPGF